MPSLGRTDAFVRVKQPPLPVRDPRPPIVGGPIAGDMDIRTADPTLEDCPVGLPETQFLVSLDSQRLEHFGWNP